MGVYFTTFCLCSVAVTWADERARARATTTKIKCLYIWLELNSNCGVVNKIGKNIASSPLNPYSHSHYLCNMHNPGQIYIPIHSIANVYYTLTMHALFSCVPCSAAAAVVTTKYNNNKLHI